MLGRKYKIVFLPIAEEDLTGIVLYISHQLQNPSGAMNVFNRIRDAIIARSKAPESFKSMSLQNIGRTHIIGSTSGEAFRCFMS